MMQLFQKPLSVSLSLFLFLVSATVFANEDGNTTQRQYTYAWLFSEDGAMKPRGGATKGPSMVLDLSVSPAFELLQESGLPPVERDRRAILAMAGDYRTSFDFIETVGFTPGYIPRAPYQSWGTERVYVVVSEEDFISLQHIIVMHFVLEDGSVSEPMVVKHWRQDWRYQPTSMQGFLGRNRWQAQQIAEQRAGHWVQSVYQVDDSPRYDAVGSWNHSSGVSIWQSDAMRRPLPRREFSVRDDYQTLYGTHRITITPHGWTQEEDALKMVLDDQAEPATQQPYLAREAGLSRYERIKHYDFSAGDAYWERTAPFWREVRAFWTGVYAENTAFSLRQPENSEPLFMVLFAMAEEAALDTANQSTSISWRSTIEAAVSPYLLRP